MDEARRAYDALYDRLWIPDMSTHVMGTLQMHQGRLWEEGLGLREAVRAVEIDKNLLRSIAAMAGEIRRAEERKRLRRIRLEEKLKESDICTHPLLNASEKTCGGSLSIVENRITVDAVCDRCKWKLETWPSELYTDLAGDYYAASEKLEGGYPRDFLLIHSIELSLKALSGRVMYPPNEEEGKDYPYDAYHWGVAERRITHNLKNLWRKVPAAIKEELKAEQVGERSVEDAICAIPDKACMSLRYADPPIEESIGDLDALAKCLLDHVRSEF